MRDAQVYAMAQDLDNRLRQLTNFIQLHLSGSALFDEAMKNLLMKKGIFTEIELKEQIGEEIKKANEAPAPEPVAEAPAAEGLVTPSPAEVAKVEETKLL